MAKSKPRNFEGTPPKGEELICWRCKRAVPKPSNILEALCKPCAAWITFEAFEHHGPIVANPRVPHPTAFGEYPLEWRLRYTPTAEEFPWYKGGFDFESVNKLLRGWNVTAKDISPKVVKLPPRG